MKLIKVQIQNFRCIDDTTPFSVKQTTCLVGKNESGKTAILQAIERLNPYDAGHRKYNKLQDYPRRHYSGYTSRHPDEEALVIMTDWLLEDADLQILEEEFGPDCLKSKEIKIYKRYEEMGTTWSVPLDQKKTLAYLMDLASLTAAEKRSFTKFNTSQELYKHLQKLAQPNAAKTALIERVGKYRDQSLHCHTIDLLSKCLPHFLYFSQYSYMNGDVSVQKLVQDIAQGIVAEGDQVFQAFLEFAGTSLGELAGATQYEELNARCEAASNAITDQIFEYWSQNQQLAVEFELQTGQPNDPPPFNTGTVMHARVKNNLHRITVPFSDRSAGFIWFFSFLVMFSQVRKTHGNVIILLDEPGLNLHGTAQRDLLRYIREKLTPHHQVIYTTHSPFMVPADDLASVRTVEDVVQQSRSRRPEVLGTKVGDDILSTDPETLFPLQGALGYEITQSLFIGEHTLLVEGPSDILYLQAASTALNARGQTGLDSRWVICPSGGLDKVHAFVSLFAGNKLHVAVLADFA